MRHLKDQLSRAVERLRFHHVTLTSLDNDKGEKSSILSMTTTFYRKRSFAYHDAVKHPHTNIILLAH